MSRIERVSYRSGFVKRLRESRHLPAITFEAADLPEDVVALVERPPPQPRRHLRRPRGGDRIPDTECLLLCFLLGSAGGDAAV